VTYGDAGERPKFGAHVETAVVANVHKKQV
jgi:hypothetical protein